MNEAVLKNGALAQRRYLSLWFPFLPFERIQSSSQDERPAVQVEKQKNALRLVACDARAKSCGLKPGMTLAEARAISPDLAADAADHFATRAMQMKLAEYCEHFTPLFACDGDDGVLMDVTGCARLFGGEKNMQAHIVQNFAQKGFTVRHALAGTPDCAHVLARFGTVTHVATGNEWSAVEKLPVAALQCSDETRNALIRAGLKTIGDVAARKSQLFTARFGSELMRKLNRILGQENIRMVPLRPEPIFSVEQRFMEPLHHMEHVMQAVTALVSEVCENLETAGEGGRCFEAGFFRSDGKLRRLLIETAKPLRDAKAIEKLFALRLETLSDPLDPGFGFDAVRLAVVAADKLPANQRHLNEPVGDTVDESTVINRLRIRYGRESVLQFKPRDSHDPLREAALVPVSEARDAWARDAKALPRPITLFSPSHPIDVISEVPDGPPMRFRWRKVLHHVVTAEGPERIAGEWWRDVERRERDYYRVEDTAGGRFWIYREGLFTSVEPPPKWFLHGVFA